MSSSSLFFFEVFNRKKKKTSHIEHTLFIVEIELDQSIRATRASTIWWQTRCTQQIDPENGHLKIHTILSRRICLGCSFCVYLRHYTQKEREGEQISFAITRETVQIQQQQKS